MRILLFTLLITFKSLSAISQTTLRLQNNTSKELYAAYVVWDSENNCYVSRGWYKIRAKSSRYFDLGNYKGPIYTHAHQYGLVYTQWGDDRIFCINPTDAFEIYYAGKLDCQTTAKFSLMSVSNGVNTYTFYP